MAGKDTKLTQSFEIPTEFLQIEDLPSLNNYLMWDDYKNRKILICQPIIDNLVDTCIMPIIRWNDEDALYKLSPEERDPINIYINTDGGDLDVVMGIVETIKASITPVRTFVLGKAYSAGAIILIAGHQRFAYSHSSILIHEGSVGIQGTSSQTEQFVDFHKRQKNFIKEFILSNTNITEEQYKQKSRDEWFLFGHEALEFGIVDALVDRMGWSIVLYLLYTDGSYRNDAGKVGGWAYLIKNPEGNIIDFDAGSEINTTSNRMEMKAIIEGLKNIVEITECGKKISEVIIYTDSMYVVNGFTKKWLEKWISNGWRKANNCPVRNKDLWIELYILAQILYLNFQWIKSHSGQEDNEICDKLAAEQVQICMGKEGYKLWKFY